MARRLVSSYCIVIGVLLALFALTMTTADAHTASEYARSEAIAHTLTGYFTKHSSWAGVKDTLEATSSLLGAPITLVDQQGRLVATTDGHVAQGTAAGSAGSELALRLSDPTHAFIGTVYVGQPHTKLPSSDRPGQLSLLALEGLVATLLAIGLGMRLHRSISRPLGAIRHATQQLAHGNYAIRINPAGPHEVADLSRTFNQMAAQIEGLEQLRRELVANVSHDLRTPLTVMRGYLEGLCSGQIADRRSAERAFEVMRAEVACMMQMVEHLRHVALQEGVLLRREHCAVDNMVQRTIARARPLAEAKQIQLHTAIPAHLPELFVDPTQFGQALFNLLDNGIRYTPPGGTITIKAGLRDSAVWISVHDTGDGIPSQHLPHIFERFYRVDHAHGREGHLGLGLAIVKEIVATHGGQVRAESPGVPGHGSMVTIVFPLEQTFRIH